MVITNVRSERANHPKAMLPAPSMKATEAAMINNSLKRSDVSTGSFSNFERQSDVDDLKLLRQFESLTSGTIGDLQTQKVYSNDVPRLAVEVGRALPERAAECSLCE